MGIGLHKMQLKSLKKGALHKQLGVKEGEKIPASDLTIKPGDSALTKKLGITLPPDTAKKAASGPSRKHLSLRTRVVRSVTDRAAFMLKQAIPKT